MRRDKPAESVENLLARFRKRDMTALARVISLVEDRAPEATALLEKLFPNTGRALKVGVTGPPGVGKSTLVGGLVSQLRRHGPTVGVIAVDPTSSFSGGALLGDRIRMGEVATSAGVFVRSMASRGSTGGLSSATHDAAEVMDAYGLEWIFLETVGVGQLELEVADSADLTLVVLMPGSGDSVQAMKAGLMEIGDIFVVNKADSQGAELMVDEISMIFEITVKDEIDRPPVVKTVATTGEGVGYLLGMIRQMAEGLRTTGRLAERRKLRIANQVSSIVEREMLKDIWENRDLRSRVRHVTEEIFSRRITPYAAARRIIEDLKRRAGYSGGSK
jgi:LAO/AO transport system kinase